VYITDKVSDVKFQCYVFKGDFDESGAHVVYMATVSFTRPSDAATYAADILGEGPLGSDPARLVADCLCPRHAFPGEKCTDPRWRQPLFAAKWHFDMEV